jgi:hypothetical protein
MHRYFATSLMLPRSTQLPLIGMALSISWRFRGVGQKLHITIEPFPETHFMSIWYPMWAWRAKRKHEVGINGT